MGPLRAGQELRRFQRVGLIAVKSATQRPSSHRAPRPQGPAASSCRRP